MDSASHDFTDSHIGVKIIWDDEGARTYATIANGTAESEALISGSTNQTRRIRIKVKSDAVEFYDRGVLVAEITTNIPDNAAYGSIFQASTQRSSGGSRTTIYLDSFAIARPDL